ncbi:hypothetical protein Q9L42_000325 (plasmid) [Methylomarinum sp. Ch1-1]|uniref:Uncharacterized protein n=1 Tax=Methylomarinum roseum TaxID=3067653 RepID=A0AAU7NP87_9GAMM|nr:hypothetical protein [Methylomarinum sp. Ch1-1]MDP4523087.1 hypothetical protein [Methylomarinum sp. Ch1-1]
MIRQLPLHLPPMIQQLLLLSALLEVREVRNIIGSEFHMAFDSNVGNVNKPQQNQAIVSIADPGVKVPSFERWMTEVFLPQPFRVLLRMPSPGPSTKRLEYRFIYPGEDGFRYHVAVVIRPPP